MLLGGDQTGDNRWCDENIPVADDGYDDYLRELKKEGLIRALDDLCRNAAEHANEHRGVLGNDGDAVRQLILWMSSFDSP